MDGNNLTTEDAITVLQNLQDWLYFSSMNGGTSLQREAIDMAIKALKSQPSEEPQRMRAKWIDTGSNEEWYAREYRCSECGDTMLGEANFCPTCGAKMEVTE